jgi:hypothetical protein
MHGHEKSDRCVVPMKPANKAERSAAEWVEGRHLVEGSTWAGNARSGYKAGLACHNYRHGLAAQLHGSPKPRTVQRYHPRQEPGAGKPHAGICAAGAQQCASLPRLRKLKEGEVTVDLFGFLTTQPNKLETVRKVGVSCAPG